jgi:aspartyl-tRNA(Asn)/glutamyl-tRNA(Gln) amidotransferase subunit A
LNKEAVELVMFNKSIKELSQDLAKGEFSSEELTRGFLDRINKFGSDLNVLITLTADEAMSEARDADQLRQKGQAGSLTGIPMMHKDIFCTEGVKTSCGSKMLDNFIAPYDATVVSKIRQAGMPMLGKTNMDEFAMGSSNETSYYGPVKNPWDTETVPGGSSGGSASAVAARLTPMATGTDTGGSIRQPAALCGITGIKPTYGRVSRYGMIAFASSLDQAGPMTRSAEDAAWMLNVMAGFDERDSTSVEKDVPDYTADLGNKLSGLKIGLPKEYFGEGLSDQVRNVVDAAVEEYKKLGAEIVEISLPNSSLSVPTYYVVAPAECSSNLSRFDGVRFGYRCENPQDLEDLYKRSRAEGFGTEVKRRIMIGTYALSAGYYDAYYLKAQRLRQLISDDFKQAFEKVDVIMGPTAPDVAFKIGEKTSDPVSMYLSDIYTIATNLAGLPGMSIPAGFVAGNSLSGSSLPGNQGDMPVGLQIIGNYFDESRLLNVAHQFQQNTDWHSRMPAGFE